jgi:hypothetical protein
MMDNQSPFYEMVATISTKESYQKGRRLLYDGSHTASMARITKDPRVSKHVKSTLDWPRVAVDYMVSDCVFDAFENDDFGVTRLLVESRGDQALLSAITNSMIGAVSFIAVIPRDDGRPILVPFSGAEATGVRTARGDELAYGLAVKERENGIVTKWYLFEKGVIKIVNPAGELLDSVDLGVDVMPFIQFSYDPDEAVSPFGRSRLSQASISALDSGLRNRSLSEQVSLINLLKGDLMMVAGSGTEGLKATEEFKTAVGTLKMMFFEGIDLDGVRLEQLQQIELSQVQSAISRAATDFATSVSMLPTSFGESPSNGSYSEGAMKQLDKPGKQTKNRVRMSYADSIKRLAIVLFKMVAQSDDVEDIEGIRTVFREDFDKDIMAGLGDAFQKFSTSFQDQNVELKFTNAYIRELVGMPLRPDVIDEPLPSFEKSRARFRDASIDGIGGPDFKQVS